MKYVSTICFYISMANLGLTFCSRYEKDYAGIIVFFISGIFCLLLAVYCWSKSK